MINKSSVRSILFNIDGRNHAGYRCGMWREKKALKLHVVTFDPTKETGIRNYVEITNNQHAPQCGLLADRPAWRHPCRSSINKCKWRGHHEHPLKKHAQSVLPHTSPGVASTQDTLSAPVPRTVTTPHRDRKAWDRRTTESAVLVIGRFTP